MKKVCTVLFLLVALALPALGADAEESCWLLEWVKSPAFPQAVGGVCALVLYLVRQNVDGKKKRVIDMVAGIANGIEKGIEDDTDHPGMKKIDKGLARFRRDWVRLHKSKKSVAHWLVVFARGAFEHWVANRNAGRA